LKFLVALRVVCPISHHIHLPHLRADVVEHIAVNWCRRVEVDDAADFDDFFDDYNASVELDFDERVVGVKRRTWERLRVWTNHAALLRGEPHMVCPRPARDEVR
jgi:hypothetical protein